ncbi:MAG TPA: PilZ domain-containing protein [Planctomycetota bacterium]|jgi:hypothetical protein
MTGRNTPRAKVRLRLDKGTLLLRQFGLTSMMCTIVDLSEAGCQIHVSWDEVDDETVTAWHEILTPTRPLTVELTEPPELRNLIFRESQVRWVKKCRDGSLDVGLTFGAIDEYQTEILNGAMIRVASEKLRSKKASEALTQTSAKLTPLPSKPATAVSKPDATALERPVAMGRAPGTSTSSISRHQRGTGAAAQLTPSRGSPAAPAQHETKAPPKQAERQRREQIYMPVLFEFCAGDGTQWEETIHRGRSIDFSEGGFKIEGPDPDCCDAGQLMERKAHAILTIRCGTKDVKPLCRVCTVQRSPLIKDAWQYGMQIVTLDEESKKLLRELYIRAGMTHMLKKR